MIFDLERQIVLEINISNYVIKMYLSQRDDEERLRLIVFYLRKITLIKLNYEIHNKKLLVIITTFNK